MTDRFARTDLSTTASCVTSEQVYCGGTWEGLISKLDYIQNMGFTAIWISPIVAQMSGDTSDGESYHVSIPFCRAFCWFLWSKSKDWMLGEPGDEVFPLPPPKAPSCGLIENANATFLNGIILRIQASLVEPYVVLDCVVLRIPRTILP